MRREQRCRSSRVGLPATWRELGEQWRIVWCRLPAEGGLSEADDILGDRPGKVVHLVASGPYADTALRLAERYCESVRSVGAVLSSLSLLSTELKATARSQDGQPAVADDAVVSAVVKVIRDQATEFLRTSQTNIGSRQG